MINLLPPKEKKELFLEEVKRLITILGSVILISLISLTLILLPIKIYLKEDVESQKIILEEAKEEYQAPDIKNLQEIVKEYNKNLLELKKFYEKYLYLTEIVEKISQIEREGIYFTNLSLNKDTTKNKVMIAISGLSKTRENLSLFKRNLEKEENFQDLYFSPASWVKPADIDFYLTLEVIRTMPR